MKLTPEEFIDRVWRALMKSCAGTKSREFLIVDREDLKNALEVVAKDLMS